jgi:hypothetical protein
LFSNLRQGARNLEGDLIQNEQDRAALETGFASRSGGTNLLNTQAGQQGAQMNEERLQQGIRDFQFDANRARGQDFLNLMQIEDIAGLNADQVAQLGLIDVDRARALGDNEVMKQLALSGMLNADVADRGDINIDATRDLGLLQSGNALENYVTDQGFLREANTQQNEYLDTQLNQQLTSMVEQLGLQDQLQNLLGRTRYDLGNIDANLQEQLINNDLRSSEAIARAGVNNINLGSQLNTVGRNAAFAGQQGLLGLQGGLLDSQNAAQQNQIQASINATRGPGLGDYLGAASQFLPLAGGLLGGGGSQVASQPRVSYETSNAFRPEPFQVYPSSLFTPVETRPGAQAGFTRF